MTIAYLGLKVKVEMWVSGIQATANLVLGPRIITVTRYLNIISVLIVFTVLHVLCIRVCSTFILCLDASCHVFPLSDHWQTLSSN